MRHNERQVICSKPPQRSIAKLTSLSTELQPLSSAGLHGSFLTPKASVTKSFSVVVSSAGRNLGKHCVILSSSRMPCLGYWAQYKEIWELTVTQNFTVFGKSYLEIKRRQQKNLQPCWIRTLHDISLCLPPDQISGNVQHGCAGIWGDLSSKCVFSNNFQITLFAKLKCPNCITNQEQNPIPLQTYRVLLNIWGFLPPQASSCGQ